MQSYTPTKLPYDIAFNIFSFSHSAYNNTSLVSTEWLHFSRLARWKNLTSWKEEDQLKFLLMLCNTGEQHLNKTASEKNYINFIELLENYRKHSNLGVEQHALTLTALAILYSKKKTVNKTDVEKKLRFVLILLESYNESLSNHLIALIKKAQGNFADFAVLKDSASKLDILIHCRENQERKARVAARKKLINSTADELFDIINKQLDVYKTDPLYLSRAIVAAEILGNLWQTLTTKLQNTILFKVCNSTNIFNTDYAEEVKHSIIIKNINFFSKEQTGIIYKTMMQQINPNFVYCFSFSAHFALSILASIWDKLSPEEQTTTYNFWLYLWDKNKVPKAKLVLGLSLKWSELPAETQKNIFEVLTMKENIGIFIEIDTIKTFQKLEPQLTEFQKKIVKEVLISSFYIASYPKKKILCNAILLYSKENDYGNTLSNINATLKLDEQPPSLLQQLKNIDTFDKSIEQKQQAAKETIKLFCQYAPDLNALQTLENEFEVADITSELSYLINAQSNTENYQCSEAWLECRQIFQDYIKNFAIKLTVDKKFI